MIRIVDNKKLDLTPDENSLYDKIVRNYTTPTNNGKNQFIDLFETDDRGIITQLIPPSKRQTSWEVWIFLSNLMISQHIRLIYDHSAGIANEFKSKIIELDAKLADVDRKMIEVDEKLAEANKKLKQIVKKEKIL